MESRELVERLREDQNKRSKHVLSELDRIERKIDRHSADVWKMVSDLIKVLEAKK